MNELQQLQRENERLRRQVLKLEHEYAANTAQLEQENAYLQAQVNVLLAKRYGASSEKIGDAQLSLFNEAEAPEPDDEVDEVEAVSSTTRSTPSKRGKRALPSDLERIEVRHERPEAERLCPHDGTTLREVGERTSEQLDIVPAKVRVLRHIQVKYACPCCAKHMVTAHKPRSPIPGSQVSPGLLAHVAVSKYLDHWPLYRQGEVFKRMGAIVHRSTMSQWMRKSGELLQPLINLLQDHVLGQSYMHMDESVPRRLETIYG
jgi:transposase